MQPGGYCLLKCYLLLGTMGDARVTRPHCCDQFRHDIVPVLLFSVISRSETEYLLLQESNDFVV